MERERAKNGGNDKYYTRQFVADYYSHIILNRYGDADYVEPTAGDGSFLNIIDAMAYDLKPEHPGVTQKDVFDLELKGDEVVIGNPPFGFAGSMAVSIVNHLASQGVKAICFILPRSFKKKSIQDKINLNYHLVFEQDVINDAFTVNGKSYNVPCVFQMWEFKSKRRVVRKVEGSRWIKFTSMDDCDVAVRRVGGSSGKVLEGLDHSCVTTYFIKVDNPTVIKALKLMDLSVVDYTAGVRSISRGEITSEVNRIMGVLYDCPHINNKE